MSDTAVAGSKKVAISESVPLINFETATVVAGTVNDTYFLIVSGTKPYINMDVRLVPVVYTDQPEYWRIDVVGFLPGYGLPALAPYAAHLDISGHRGMRGIEVVGATNSELIDIEPSFNTDESDVSQNLGEWSAVMDLSGFIPQVVVNGSFPADEKPRYELIAKPQRRASELNLELTYGYLVTETAQSTKQVFETFPAGSADQFKTVLVSDANRRTIARMEVQPDPNSK